MGRIVMVRFRTRMHEIREMILDDEKNEKRNR